MPGGMPEGYNAPRSAPAGIVVPGARPLAKLYATSRSALACEDTVSLMCVAPFTTPGGNPVIEVPGFNETSPFMMDNPVLVIAEVAIIPKEQTQDVIIEILKAQKEVMAREINFREIEIEQEVTVKRRIKIKQLQIKSSLR